MTMELLFGYTLNEKEQRLLQMHRRASKQAGEFMYSGLLREDGVTKPAVLRGTHVDDGNFHGYLQKLHTVAVELVIGLNSGPVLVFEHAQKDTFAQLGLFGGKPQMLTEYQGRYLLASNHSYVGRIKRTDFRTGRVENGGFIFQRE